MNIRNVTACRLVLAAVGLWLDEVVVLDVAQHVSVLVCRERIAFPGLFANGLVGISSQHQPPVEAVRLLEAEESPLNAETFPHRIRKLLKGVLLLLGITPTIVLTEFAELFFFIEPFVKFIDLIIR